MPRIKLNHHCRLKGAVGNNGDVIEVSDKLSKLLLDRKGAVLVDDDNKPIQPESDAGDEDDPELTDDEEPDKEPTREPGTRNQKSRRKPAAKDKEAAEK